MSQYSHLGRASARENVSDRLAAMRGEQPPRRRATPAPAAKADEAPKPKPAPAVSTKGLGLTALDIEAAHKAERQRVAKVFASAASRGRERTAADFLVHDKLSAAEIVKHLAALPTDAEFDRRRAADSQRRSSAAWDAAIAKMGGRNNG